MTANLLDVRGLRTWFETPKGIVKAVDGVDLTLKRGEILGLVGESGSGKSITGFSLLGLVDPPGRVVEGEIRFLGEDLRSASAKRQRALRGNRIAMIFQDPMMTLNPVLRIGTQMIETVQAHARVSKAEARARARDALGMVGIPHPEERIDAYPQEINVGYFNISRTVSPEAAAQITHHPKALLVNKSYLLLPRSAPDSEALLGEFNAQLQAFRDTGRYQSYFDAFDTGDYELDTAEPTTEPVSQPD